MSAPIGDEPHPVAPDGYCPVCERVGCTQRWPRARPSPVDHTAQLNRLELKLNRLLRAAGLEGETT